MHEIEQHLESLIEHICSGRYTSQQIEDRKENFLNRIKDKIDDSYSKGYEHAQEDFLNAD